MFAITFTTTDDVFSFVETFGSLEKAPRGTIDRESWQVIHHAVTLSKEGTGSTLHTIEDSSLESVGNIVTEIVISHLGGIFDFENLEVVEHNLHYEGGKKTTPFDTYLAQNGLRGEVSGDDIIKMMGVYNTILRANKLRGKIIG